MCKTNPVHQHCFLYFQHLQNVKRSIFAFLFCLPTSLLALVLLLPLVYNGSSVFYIQLPFPRQAPPEPPNFSPESLTGKFPEKFSSSLMYVVKEQNQPLVLTTHLPLLQKPAISMVPISQSSVLKPRKVSRRKALAKVLRFGAGSEQFPARIRDLFKNSVCKVGFFKTLISSLGSFGN